MSTAGPVSGAAADQVRRLSPSTAIIAAGTVLYGSVCFPFRLLDRVSAQVQNPRMIPTPRPDRTLRRRAHGIAPL
eukprot:767230-Hanusia_phi.AAC.5